MGSLRTPEEEVVGSAGSTGAVRVTVVLGRTEMGPGGDTVGVKQVEEESRKKRTRCETRKKDDWYQIKRKNV